MWPSPDILFPRDPVWMNAMLNYFMTLFIFITIVAKKNKIVDEELQNPRRMFCPILVLVATQLQSFINKKQTVALGD